MPQFNWSVFGPFLLLLVALGGGIVFLVSVGSSQHSSHRSTVAATIPVQATLSATTNVSAVVPPKGARLPGRAIGSPHLRAMPSSDAAVVGDLQSGEVLEVSGCSASCGWYLVTLNGQSLSGWVSAAFVTIQGDDRTLPEIR